MDLTKYRRIYPKLRLSWSIYRRFVYKNLPGIFDYLLEIEKPTIPKSAGAEGSRIHSKIELEGIKNIGGIEKLIDCSFEYKLEHKIVLQREKYQIVCVPDLHNEEFVLDWKTGGTNGYEQQLQLYMWAIGDECKTGYLVPIKEVDGVIKIRRGTKEFKRNRFASDWEYKFEDMANDIEMWIQNGTLEKYLKNYNYTNE